MALAAAPSVSTHPARAARIALMHTWINTQDEGWWRLALDQLAVPFTYISTQDVAEDANLGSKYDVILFPPVGRASGQQIVTGLPMYGNPLPWKTTELTPNIGKIDSTDDMRPGMGWQGLANLQKFVRDGGRADYRGRHVELRDSVRLDRGRLGDAGAAPQGHGRGAPLEAGRWREPDRLRLRRRPSRSIPPTVRSSASATRSAGRGGRGGAAEPRRATGRGTPDEADQPQGRPPSDPLPPDPKVEPWQATPIREEQLRNGISIIPPSQRPRVVFRYGDARDLLVSGLLDGGTEIAQRPMVVDVPVDKGHVVLFSNNPIWRGETHGSYFLVLNAILNHDNLNAGRKLDRALTCCCRT